MAFEILEVKPVYDGIFTTATKLVYDKTTQGGLVLANQMEGALNLLQTVAYVSDDVKSVKVGDVVKINLKAYMVPKHKSLGVDAGNVDRDELTFEYSVPTEKIGGKEYLFLHQRDIDYIITKYTPSDGGLLQ